MSNNIFKPNKEFAKNANIKNMCEYKELVDNFEKNYEGTWGDYAASKIDWFIPFDNILDEPNAPFYRWFDGGKMNVSYQCIDRHLKDKKNKAAIIWEGD